MNIEATKLDPEIVSATLSKLRLLSDKNMQDISIEPTNYEQVREGLNYFSTQPDLEAKYKFRIINNQVISPDNELVKLVDICRAIIISLGNTELVDDSSISNEIIKQVQIFYREFDLTKVAKEYVSTKGNADLEGKIVQLAILIAKRTVF